MTEIFAVGIEPESLDIVVLTMEEEGDYTDKDIQLTIFTLVAENKQDALEKSVRTGLVANAIEEWQYMIGTQDKEVSRLSKFFGGPDMEKWDEEDKKILVNLQDLQKKYQPA